MTTSINFKDLTNKELITLRDDILEEITKRHAEKWNEYFFQIIDDIITLMDEFGNNDCFEIECENCEKNVRFTWETLKEGLMNYDLRKRGAKNVL